MASTSSTIGGSSSADEMFTAAVHQLISKGMWKAADTETVRPLIQRLNEPHAKFLINALPVMVAGLTARLPMALVGNSPMIASIVKEIIMDGTNSFVEVVQNGGNITDKDGAEGMLKNAMSGVMSRMVLVDPLRHFHRAECANLQLIKPPVPQRQERKNKQGNVIPQPPPPAPFPELTLEDALKQNLRPSPCCHESFAAPAATKPAKPRKFRSVMELLGSLEPSKRKIVMDWYAALTPEDRAEADKALPDLTNEGELIAFVDVARDYPDLAMASLKLAKDRKVTDPLEPYIVAAGTAIKRGAAEAHADLVKFDKSLAPKVAALEAKRAARTQARTQMTRTPTPAPKRSWLRELWEDHLRPW